MPIISRRVSLLMLSFAFFLLFAPALFSPAIFAQDSGEYKNIWPMAIQWGIGGIMFTVWLYQFKKSKAGDETVVLLLTAHLEESNKITTLAFEKYDKHTDGLLKLIEDNQKQSATIAKESQDRSEVLIGVLSRLEVNLARPLRCPLLDRRDDKSEGI